METEKRQIVLYPKSIKISSETPLSSEISTDKNSPFSDGYDYYAEIERLETLPESEQFAQQDAFDLLAERELLLKQAIYKKDFFVRRQHISPDDIDLDDLLIIHRPRQAGRLRNQKRPDSVEVHVRKSSDLWFGRGNKEQKRQIGLRSAAINLAHLMRQALDGNFYAEAVLYQAEMDIAKLENTIEKETGELTQGIEEYRKKGLSVEMLASDKPRQIEMVISGYGGRLALLLLAYDKYYRTYLTLKKISVTAKQTKASNIIWQAIYDFCDEINDKAESLQITQSIKNVNRHQLLNDDEVVKKLCEATREELLPPLPLGVLTYAIRPQMIDIENNGLSDEEKEKLKQIAIENKLVISE